MDRKNFEHLVGKPNTKILLKPQGFRLVGTVDELFDHCLRFTTHQQTSYIDYDSIMSVIWTEGC